LSYADELRALAERQRRALQQEGYTPEEVERGVGPVLCFLAQVEWEEAHDGQHYHDGELAHGEQP
jgi:hypothetical protein